MSHDPAGSGLPAPPRSAAIDAFLERAASTPLQARPGRRRGRIIFALDATASRQPSWDHACRIQGEMFEATAALGGIDIQLVFYRGFAECKASRWLSSAADLHRAMRKVSCIGGHTQIGKVLSHALAETAREPVQALILVGDAMEERADDLCRAAGELGLLGLPIFVFQEGSDRSAESALRQMAELSRGAYFSFDLASARRLRDLLGAVAVYAAGGHRALVAYGVDKGPDLRLLTDRLGRA